MSLCVSIDMSPLFVLKMYIRWHAEIEMAEDQEKPTTERRIHVLPVELLDRIRAYQADNNIPSEVEAVRRLLSEALQARDSIDDIMKQVAAQFKIDRDLRNIAKEVLTGHTRVNRLEIEDNCVRFGMRTGDAGSISKDGTMQVGTVDDEGYFRLGENWPRARSWTDSPAPELDEEIPF